MPRVILDWDEKYKKGIIFSEFLEMIRANFSVPNESKIQMSKRGMPTYYMSDFISPITSTGRFDLGLYFEINEYLKHNSMDYEVITTESLSNELLQTYSWKFSYDIPQLSVPLYPHQISGVKRGIHLGYGIMIVGTAGGKTLLMASLIQTIRKYQPPFTSIVILPSNILMQTHKEFLNYGIPESDMSMWGGENELDKRPIILASAETLKSNLTTCSTLKPKTEIEWNEYNPKTKDKHETYNEYLDDFKKCAKSRKSAWIKRRKSIINELSDVDLLLMDECLKPGQLISTINGHTAIENIKAGDLVLSFNTDKKINEYKKVIQTYKNIYKSTHYNEYIEITLENDTTITVTPNHKIYTDRGIIRADNLNQNDNIITLS